jgi:hypothetical protein
LDSSGIAMLFENPLPFAAWGLPEIGSDLLAHILQAFAGGAAQKRVQAETQLPRDEKKEARGEHAEMDEEPKQHLRHQRKPRAPFHDSAPPSNL